MRRRFFLPGVEIFLLIAGTLLIAAATLNLLRYRLFQELPSSLAKHVVAPANSSDSAGWATRYLLLPAVGNGFGAIAITGKLEAPRLGLSVLVVDGDEDQGLAVAAVHLSGTAAVGEAGNAVIAAHRDTAFWPLRNIRLGDQLRIRTAQRVYHYQTDSIRIVTPDDLTVLNSQSSPVLTLVTCYPFRYVGNAPKRFVVQAKLVIE